MTWSASCARIAAATGLPSMTLALTAGMLDVRGAVLGRGASVERVRSLASGDRSVLGHQLALGTVTGEAHDDHAAGLDACHDAVAEGRVDDVLAEPEGDRRTPVGRARRPPRPVAAGRRAHPSGRRDAAGGDSDGA